MAACTWGNFRNCVNLPWRGLFGVCGFITKTLNRARMPHRCNFNIDFHLMKNAGSNLVDVKNLRIGLFVELELGWMAHPFPTSSFKISSEKQIESIRGLGLKQVRVVPEKSDPELPPSLSPEAEAAQAARQALERARQESELQERVVRERRVAALKAQQEGLLVCERRFGEASRLYRKAMEQVQSHPEETAKQCQLMVNGFVSEIMADGESAIRLLTETAGDKFGSHSVNVTVMCLLLGRAMGLKTEELQDLGVAALLHDIGKVALPDRVRWPDENFSSAETKLYQEHVLQSMQMGKAMALSKGALLAIAQHHEQFDGSGFPSRQKGENMSQGARILALVNRYDNLCNPSRPSAAMTPHEALSLIFAQLKARFDPTVLSAFIRMMGVYPPGSVVQLVDERYASVVSVNSSRPLKPRILVFESSVPKHEALVLDLEQVPNMSIRRSLKPSALPAPALEYLSPRQRVCYFFERTSDRLVLEDVE